MGRARGRPVGRLLTAADISDCGSHGPADCRLLGASAPPPDASRLMRKAHPARERGQPTSGQDRHCLRASQGYASRNPGLRRVVLGATNSPGASPKPAAHFGALPKPAVGQVAKKPAMGRGAGSALGLAAGDRRRGGATARSVALPRRCARLPPTQDANHRQGCAMPDQSISDDHDSPWKEALERYFPEFLALLFPEVHAGVDWSRGHSFLDKELQQVVRDAEAGRRRAGYGHAAGHPAAAGPPGPPRDTLRARRPRAQRLGCPPKRANTSLAKSDGAYRALILRRSALPTPHRGWPACSGIDGRLGPEYATNPGVGRFCWPEGGS